MRVACKTSKDFDWMHTALSSKASECASLSIAFSIIILPGWDSLTFCTNLYHASRLQGMKVASNFNPALARVIYEWGAGGSDLDDRWKEGAAAFISELEGPRVCQFWVPDVPQEGCAPAPLSLNVNSRNPEQRKKWGTAPWRPVGAPSAPTCAPRRGSVTKLILQEWIYKVLSVPLRDPWPLLINAKLQVFGIDG